MAEKNRLARALAKVDRLPAPVATALRTTIMHRIVPFVGTAGLRIDELTEARCVVTLADRRPARNHIGGMHAGAMALVAETATGFLLGMTVPDSGAPVIKTMHIDYVRRAKGDLCAVATLSPEDQARLRTEERGEVVVPVTVTDASGHEPIRCAMTWAWVPKKRGPKASGSRGA